MTILEQKALSMYVKFLQNFEFVEDFAIYYRLSEQQAVTLLKIGKALHESR